MSKGTNVILVIVYSFLVVMSLKCDYLTVSGANLNPFSFLTSRSSSTSSASSNSFYKQPPSSPVTSSITSLIPISLPSTTQVTNALSSVDWKHWLTKLSELALPAIKDAQLASGSGGGPPGLSSSIDDKQLSALWNVINFARYVLC